MSLRWLLLGSLCVAAVLAVTVVLFKAADTNTPSLSPAASHTDDSAIDVAGIDPERGHPLFVERFSELEHGGHRQSWGAAQAPDGAVYIANSSGILRYDGAAWTLISTDLGLVRMVKVLEDGRVVAVGEGGFGELRADSLGTLAFNLLVPSDSLGGEEVWSVFEEDDAVVLQTFDRLVRTNKGRSESVVLAPEGRRFHKAFDVAGRLVVRLEGTGLMEYLDGELQLLRGGEAFADVAVRALFDLDEAPGGALLAVTDADFYRLDPEAENPLALLPSRASDVLREGRAYHGCRIGGGDAAAFAITTIGQGAIIVDGEGTLLQHLGADVGVTTDALVLGCTLDAQGGLWLALSDGILRVDALAPLSVFGAESGLPGSVYSVVRHEGQLYVGTERGVFRQTRPELGQKPRFEPVVPSQNTTQAWSLYPTSRGLLVASTEGVYVVDSQRARRLMDGPAYAFIERPGAPDELLVGLKSGIHVLASEGGWSDAGLLIETEGEIRAFAPLGNAVLAMERDGRLLRIEGTSIEALGADEGIPEGVVTAQSSGDGLRLLARDAVYTADASTLLRSAGAEIDVELTALARLVAGGESEASYYNLTGDDAGRTWLSGPAGTLVLEQTDTGWADVTPPPFRRLAGVLPVYAEGEVTFVGTNEGLYRLVGQGARYGIAGQALVRGLTAEDDGVLFGGAAREGALLAPYGQALRFGFALPAFNDPDGTEYRSFLGGFDRRASEWSSDAQRDYTNLPPGDYTFHVEARTAQGAVAEPVALAFTIPPPWYLSRWAFGGYMVLVALFIGGVVALSSRHERRKTAVAAARATELATLNEQLREADRLKDDMLANTSHELRTPLTAIIGFSEILQEYEGGDPDEVRELASHMFSGGRRLLHTVNDLLDIAQLRAGKLRLEPRDIDAAVVVRAVAAELRSLADEKQIALAVYPEGLSVPAYLDPAAFARVLTNLISNAIKFTDHGGVAVLVDAEDGTLTVSVQDSGIGIGPEFVPHLFDEYVQESRGHARLAEGSGLGLAITRRVVTLMDGTIDVVSELGRGTCFTVQLPVETRAQVPEAAPEPPAEARETDWRQGAWRATDQAESARR